MILAAFCFLLRHRPLISVLLRASTGKLSSPTAFKESQSKHCHLRSPPVMCFPLPRRAIALTAEEESVRKLLVDVAAEIDSSLPKSDGDAEPLTLRFTGGWVRDKLLGQQCHDIDVGINKMTGFEFATRLGQFLVERQDEYSIPARSIHKIESNPEKSKHLETATTKIMNLDIDFVNLRSETYSGDSRIPQMKFGTPEEDALRRDACVNALFYNIHTQKVEDWTKRGLEDLNNKLIRTPLAPFETFHDDPLRVLRLIRFASRLDFTIIPEVQEAMRDPRIKKALRLKISRERVGIEIEKMIQGPNPQLALTQIYSLDLFDCIFAPPIEELPSISTSHMSIATDILCHIMSCEGQTYSNLRYLVNTHHDQYLGWLIASLSPWAGGMFEGVDASKNIPAAATAAREGLKIPTKLYNTIINSYKNYDMTQETVQKHSEGIMMSRGLTGMFVRRLGTDWKIQYLCAMLLETIWVWEEGSASPSREAEEIIQKYSKFLHRVEKLGLLQAYTFKPILNGKEMMVVLDQKKAGPWMMGALNALMEWQLDNPEEDRETAKIWVRGSKDRLLQST